MLKKISLLTFILALASCVKDKPQEPLVITDVDILIGNDLKLDSLNVQLEDTAWSANFVDSSAYVTTDSIKNVIMANGQPFGQDWYLDQCGNWNVYLQFENVGSDEMNTLLRVDSTGNIVDTRGEFCEYREMSVRKSDTTLILIDSNVTAMFFLSEF